ncbi:hypothetical protein VTL71DRAFT_10335 [Oculimacula yallundae]|uniref:Uncharacterized protein n=1 Tax=Oculimacula yallundae TaxID=86028 RepID=A0ABR4CUA4_9HELO
MALTGLITIIPV